MSSAECQKMNATVVYGSRMKKSIGAYVKEWKGGKILVAESNEGICSILFGDDQFSMLEELTQIFPQDIVELKVGPSHDHIVSLIEKGERYQDLRLDIRTGTETQQKVWLEIMRIPRGETATYAELAERIGNPKAWRSVATACAKNVIAYVIPCHRVVSKNGDKMNYRWGSEVKKKLLKIERKETE